MHLLEMNIYEIQGKHVLLKMKDGEKLRGRVYAFETEFDADDGRAVITLEKREGNLLGIYADEVESCIPLNR